jgi:hypothetical protein
MKSWLGLKPKNPKIVTDFTLCSRVFLSQKGSPKIRSAVTDFWGRGATAEGGSNSL